MMDKTSNLFDNHLKQLINDCTVSRNDLRTTIETLITIYKNLNSDKDNEKYRKINTDNTNFQNKVWRHSAAKQLLLSSGWRPTLDGSIVFDDPNIDVNQCLHLLVDNRDVKPDSKDWINSGQQFVDPLKVRDNQLRESAQKQRLQELKQFEENKRQTQTVAENIKKEIKSDVRFRQMKAQNKQTND